MCTVYFIVLFSQLLPYSINFNYFSPRIIEHSENYYIIISFPI